MSDFTVMLLRAVRDYCREKCRRIRCGGCALRNVAERIPELLSWLVAVGRIVR